MAVWRLQRRGKFSPSCSAALTGLIHGFGYSKSDVKIRKRRAEAQYRSYEATTIRSARQHLDRETRLDAFRCMRCGKPPHPHFKRANDPGTVLCQFCTDCECRQSVSRLAHLTVRPSLCLSSCLHLSRSDFEKQRNKRIQR